jgi:hypothetical protein
MWSMAGSLVAPVSGCASRPCRTLVASHESVRGDAAGSWDAGPLVRSLNASRLAAGARSATVDGDSRAKRGRAPSSESNPSGMSRRDDWFSSESRIGGSLFGGRRCAMVLRVCLRRARHHRFSRPSRWHAVVTGEPARRDLRLRPAVSARGGRGRAFGFVPRPRPSGPGRCTSSEVTSRDRVGAATRAPSLGLELGHCRLAGGRRVRLRSEGRRSSLACRR